MSDIEIAQQANKQNSKPAAERIDIDEGGEVVGLL
jgi:hypothetical protein